MSKEYKRICRFCGKEFITTHHTKHYCPDCSPPKWKCANCGKEFELNDTQKIRVINGEKNIYCSCKCNGASELTKKKRGDTNKKLYGAENVFASEKIKEKIKKTNRKNLGVENPAQSEKIQAKIKATNLKNLGVEYPWQSKKIQQKIKKTFQQIYKVDHPMQLDWVKDKIRITSKEKYNVEHPMKNKNIRAKAARTYKERTGYENPSQNPKVQRNKRKNYKQKTGYDNPGQNPIVRTKMKATYKEKTGYDNPSKNPDVKQKKINTHKSRTGYDNPMHNPKTKEKVFQNANKTRAANGNRSKNEIFFEERLQALGLKKNKDYYTEYNKDLRYPFHCDFYLVKEDLFIELNCCQMHGGHWYNSKNKKDRELLKLLQDKISLEHPQYKHIIYTWTKSDPKKRKIAEKNNLNYIALWNKEDINKWFENGMSVRKDWKI